MLEYRCTQDGFYYYDTVVREERFAPNTLLFLLGYARTFGDIYVSDKLFLPNTLVDSTGSLLHLTNFDFQNAARAYLSYLDKVEVLDTGDRFELYGLPLVLEQIGFFNYYQGTTSTSTFTRVPHIPLFTKRSQDYKRIYDILTQSVYWGEGSPSKGNPDLTQSKITSRIKQETTYPKYTVYNTSYQGNRAEAIELYSSFGSLNYLSYLYPDELKSVFKYDDMCSWFIWESLSLTSLYQFSLGALYAMSQMGYGTLPFTARPLTYAKGFKYIQFIDEAFFWFQNTPLDQLGDNPLFYINADIFRIDTYPQESTQLYTTGRLLSSSIDQPYLYNSVTGNYSVDDGATWLSLQEFQTYAQLHNQAYPVTDYLSLYRGNSQLSFPLSSWEW